jgi:hypothetical protein
MDGPTRPERGNPNPYPPGGPAIQPRITGADASTAAYTEADVRQYLAAHPMLPTTDGTEPVIAKVLFIPASEASALTRGASIGRPDTTLVCCVEVHGNLSTSWMSRPLGARVPSTAHVGILVFDAQTGNVLNTRPHWLASRFHEQSHKSDLAVRAAIGAAAATRADSRAGAGQAAM